MIKFNSQSFSFEPSMLVLFGATGDLAADYLLPALYRMDTEKMLPQDLKIVCVGRRDLDAKSYLNFIFNKSESLKKLSLPQARSHFLKHLIYFQADFDKPSSFKPLSDLLADRKQPRHICHNRLYYFATAPQYFTLIAKILKFSGLLDACPRHHRQTRILVEKPFGHDFKSARALNHTLLQYFTEQQIYRIDHYQGKETVQNLIVARFANALFEPLWNNKHIDHMQISVLEKDRVGNRAPFYDATGALRDIVQNHLLQMLALIAMDEPKELQTELIRDQKVKVLQTLQPFTNSNTQRNVLRAQYRGYERELGKKSKTETYTVLKVFLDNNRWRGVPFYLRTGKALNGKIAEVSIHFKEPLKCLFRGCAANVLTFRIQPDESVYLHLNNKVPGFGIELHQASLEFSYRNTFRDQLPKAYERLLLDFIQGDQRLFIRSDEIEAAWKFIDSVIKNWNRNPVYSYKSGTPGPKQADEFIQKDGHQWWTK